MSSTVAPATSAERAERVLMQTYARQPITIAEGSGVWVRDSDGREYLDMVAGIAVNVLGHAHPAVQATLAKQARRLVHTSNLYFTGEQIELAELLIATAFESRAFFCNSGTEAVEAAIKLARKWGRLHRNGAHRIVCMEGAFHGRTLGALAATGVRRYQEPFEPLLAGFVRVPFGDVEAIAAAIDDSVCAVLLEPIQGETGVHPLPAGGLRELRELCDARDVLLVLDEVQTGMGRTGRWWAHQHEDVAPDVMAIAKGLGGGVPIGAVLAAPRADVFEPGDHGSTFGGNPLATAVAATVVRVIEEEGLVPRAAQHGEYLMESLSSLREEGFPVDHVRGRGLMVALALSADIAPQTVEASLQHGLLVNAIGQRTLRLVPPLIASQQEIDEAVSRLRRGLQDADT